MRRPIALMSAALIIFGSGGALASEENAQQGSLEDEVVDFLKLRDPFASQFPQKKIIKTPVVHSVKTTDNNKPKPIEPPVMRPVAAEKPVVLPTMALQGILYGTDRPQVIIEDNSYGVGEVVKGATIRSIGRSGVVFLFQGKEFHVNIDQ